MTLGKRQRKSLSIQYLEIDKKISFFSDDTQILDEENYNMTLKKRKMK